MTTTQHGEITGTEDAVERRTRAGAVARRARSCLRSESVATDAVGRSASPRLDPSASTGHGTVLTSRPGSSEASSTRLYWVSSGMPGAGPAVTSRR